jgi:hypothetical protein
VLLVLTEYVRGLIAHSVLSSISDKNETTAGKGKNTCVFFDAASVTKKNNYITLTFSYSNAVFFHWHEISYRVGPFNIFMSNITDLYSTRHKTLFRYTQVYFTAASVTRKNNFTTLT